MATRLTLRQRLGEETGLATLCTATALGSSTSLVDGSHRAAGPFGAQRFPRGSPIRVTNTSPAQAGSRAGENTYVDVYTPASGTFTVTPALTGGLLFTDGNPVDSFEVWDSKIGHVDRIDEGFDRTLGNIQRWAYTPLTLVTDGDMEASGVSDWTLTNVNTTLSIKTALAFPVVSSRQALRVLNTGANGRAASASINAVPNDGWRVNVLVRTATGTARLVVRDVTNGANITLNGDGSDSTDAAWRTLSNTFTIPTGCEEIQVWLTGVGASDDGYWTAIVCHPTDAARFQLPARITSDKQVGNVLYRYGTREITDFQFKRWNLDGNQATPLRVGNAVILQLNAPAVTGVWAGTSYPLYFEELQPFPAFASDADDTAAPTDLVLAWAKFEVWRLLQEREPKNEEYRRLRHQFAREVDKQAMLWDAELKTRS